MGRANCQVAQDSLSAGMAASVLTGGEKRGVILEVYSWWG